MRSVFIAAATLATSAAALAALAAASGGQVHGGGEPPRAVHDDPDGQPAVVAIGHALQLAVGKPDPLPSGPLGPEVGVPGACRAGGVERGVGELPQRQSRELGVYPSVVIIHATRTYLTSRPAP